MNSIFEAYCKKFDQQLPSSLALDFWSVHGIMNASGLLSADSHVISMGESSNS